VLHHLQQECDLIALLDTLVDNLLASVAAGDLEAVEVRSGELSPVTAKLEQLRLATDEAEAELVVCYRDIPLEVRLAELGELLPLRQERTAMLEKHLAKEQLFRRLLTEHMEGLADVGRNLSHTLRAFHGYRRAAQVDKPLLNVRK